MFNKFKLMPIKVVFIQIVSGVFLMALYVQQKVFRP